MKEDEREMNEVRFEDDVARLYEELFGCEKHRTAVATLKEAYVQQWTYFG